MSSRQDWLPDFGLYLAGLDLGDKTFVVPDFPMYNLYVRDQGKYMTGANTSVDGQEYAATVDFEQAALDGLIATLPAHVADAIRGVLAELDESGDYYAKMAFPEPIMVTVEAHLGAVAHGEAEDFIPLVADRISYEE